MADIIIDAEFNSLIAPLAHDEYRLLEQSIIDDSQITRNRYGEIEIRLGE